MFMIELRNEGNFLILSFGLLFYGLFCQLINVDFFLEIYGVLNFSLFKSVELLGVMKVVR